MCTFSDVMFWHLCIFLEKSKENQCFWLSLGLAGRLGWLAGVASTLEKTKENQCFVAPTLEKTQGKSGFWALWGASGTPGPPWSPWELPWAPWGPPWAPEDPRGQEIYTQTPDQPPEMAATSNVNNIILLQERHTAPDRGAIGENYRRKYRGK